MASELALAEKQSGLIKHPEFSSEQVRILAETVAKGCDQNELGFFLNVCKMKQLDPFTGQVHCVKRWDADLGREKMVIQVGISGFRVIASRTGELAGISESEYDSEDGPHPNWARVTVYRYGRDNEKIAYPVKARWSEYVQTKKDGTPNRMWNKMPYIMLSKCAESMALRKAFPDELSGMYSDEEMDQADGESGGVAPSSLKPPVNMPKSLDDKKPDPKPAAQQPPKTAQTTSTPNPAPAAELEELSGEIVTVTPGKNGVVVLNIAGKVVVVPGRLATDDLIPKAKVLLLAAKVTIKGQHMFEAREIKMAVPPVEDVMEGEIIEPGATDPVLDEARAAGLSGLFDENPSMEAPEAPAAEGADRPGTAGMKRAKRLHTLITQNHKNVGFTEEHLKKYLATQRLEHARDLACPPKGSDAFNAYEYACSMAVGETDYHEVIED